MSQSDEASHETALARAPRWKRSQSLELVYQLNEQCLELLAGVATTNAGRESQLVSANRELWFRLEPKARNRVARMPFVILDLHFAEEEWWRRVIDVSTSAVRESDPSNGLPRELGERLVQETLMFAWQMARSDRTAAQVSFAMLPPVAEIIGALMPSHVRNIASQRYGEIHVRWGKYGRFWRDLLLAAEAADEGEIAALHLHAKLLLLGPLVRTRL